MSLVADMALMSCRWVKTDMGQGFADAVGVEDPPLEMDVCVKELLVQVSTH